MNINFDPIATQALDLMENSTKSIFLTGKAGTGKSTLINHFIETTQKNILVLAPTWVAAVNIGGTTIHSFFGLHPGITLEEVRDGEYGMNALKWKILEKLDTIVIDEVSMVRADMMEMLHVILQDVYGDEEVFGGKQMIFVWDLYQLPPIVRDEEKAYFREVYGNSYFFAPSCYESLEPTTIELQHMYRQEDAGFKKILNKIRIGLQTAEDLKTLNQTVWPTDDLEGVIYLMTTNADAAMINKQKLMELETEEYRAFSSIDGEVPSSMYMNDNTLVFKPGAQVMMLVNGMEYKNGSIGTLISRDEDDEIAKIEIDHEIVEVEAHTRNIRKPTYNEKEKKIKNEVVGSFTQLPFKLARAITIHKSQGLTFDRMVIDFGRRVFASGQAYVALSRITSLDGLTLTRPLQMHDVRCDAVVREWMMEEMESTREAMIQDAIKQKETLSCSYMNFKNQVEELRFVPTKLSDVQKQGIAFRGVELEDQQGEVRLLNAQRMFELVRA